MKAIYAAVLWPKDNGNGYFIKVPDVPGCATSGKDLVEAMEMMRDALAGCLCVLEDTGEPLPAPRLPAAISCEPGETLALIDVDTIKYRMETDNRAVRKNVSLPAWMATMAEKKGINCSQVLQESLKRMI
ncbi:MAG: type II toxin-antitoxin system HicB family antitoxin, partial [Candidatus Limiplasma sp.]|nr:type II toxin-antitoxin system HicB family antitoxin [Candidatus Limiplasma sp.]